MKNRLLIFLTIITCISYQSSAASAAPNRSLATALELIQSGEYVQANEILSTLDLNAGGAKLKGVILNLQGANLIRLDQSIRALGLFDQAEAAGFDKPILNLNRGRAFLALDSPNRAWLHFSLYALAYPNSARVYQYLGLASQQLKQYSAAKHYFELSHQLNLDDDLPLYYLAKLAYEQGQNDLSAHYLDQLLANGDHSNIDFSILDKLSTYLAKRASPSKRSKIANPIGAWFSLSSNHNDNVLGLANGAPKPAGIDSPSDHSTGLAGGLTWRAYDQGGQLFQLGYQLNTNDYNTLDQFDTVRNTLTGTYSKWLSQSTLGSATLDISDLQLNSASFLNTSTLKLSASRQIEPKRKIGATYQYSDYDYAHPSLTGARDRDGSEHRLLTHINQQYSDWDTRAELQFRIADTQGQDYDLKGYALSFLASRDLPAVEVGLKRIPLSLSASIGFSKSHYDGVNSLSEFKRQDERLQTALSIRSKINEKVTAEARLSHSKNSSNIAFFDYDRTQYSLSITASL